MQYVCAEYLLVINGLFSIELFRIDLDFGDGLDPPVPHRLEKAISSSGVAGYSRLIDLQQNAIAVAVPAKFDQGLDLSGFFTFAP